MISVCMATYNGERYIKEQVKSILDQLGPSDELVISDDSSEDATRAIINSFEDVRIVFIKHIPCGIAKNFDNAIRCAKGDYIFLADQDDVWLPGKINAAITALTECKSKIACYFSGYTLVDSGLREIPTGHFDIVPNELQSVLGYNCAVGATMAFTRGLADAICSVAMPDIYMHDWWLVLVCLSLGGRVFRDESSYLLYRQHGGNMVGCNRSMISRLCNRFPWSREQRRLYRVRSGFAKELLLAYGKMMDEKTKRDLSIWAEYLDSVANRLRLLALSFSIRYREHWFKKHLFLSIDIICGRA